MKKKVLLLVIAIVIVLVVVLFFVFTNGSKKETGNQSQTNLLSSASKILVVYFSHAGENYGEGYVEVGNTKMMASYIADYLNANTFEIIPDKTYPESYEELVEEAQKEQREDIPVGYVGEVDDFDQYDVVFIGYPILDGEISNVVQGFLDKHDFKGKTVIPFNTHEGSGDAGTYEFIRKKLSNVVVLDGLALNGREARTEKGKEETIAWLQKLGFQDQSSDETQEEDMEGEDNMNEDFVSKLNITVNGKSYRATLEDNETTTSLVE